MRDGSYKRKNCLKECMRKIILLIALNIVIILCSIYSAKAQYKECIEHFQSYDTITINGNFLRYHINNKNAQLEYGNKDFRKFLPKEFDCDIADAWIPRLKYDHKNFMLLHYGCGNPCWGLLLLPLNSVDTVRNIMHDLAYDPETTKLVYTDNENLLIENLSTHEIQIIKLPECGGANMTYCLDSVFISNSELKYQFFVPHKIDDNPVKTTYTINIK